MPLHRNVSYDRPIPAQLIVRLENGEEWAAEEEDLSKFGFVRRLHAYVAFRDTLDRYLREYGGLEDGDALTDSELNPLRYLAEIAITSPDILHFLEQEDEDGSSTAKKIAALEQRLRASRGVEA